jgi:2-dehydro-3-deoxyphosphogluconate aldolase/(4S)-4-hydroxy-2-oxoglutarate aldolase
MLKFFPAESSGGVRALKALAGPLPAVGFCPTGGVGPGNVRDYLALANVVCVGGSWIAPETDVARGDWPAIEARAREAAGLRS